MRRIVSYGSQVVNPLNSNRLLKIAFRLKHDERQMDLIHYLIIKKINPSLMEIPFAMQGWNHRLKNYGAPESFFSKPVMQVSKAGNTNKNWHHVFNKNERFKKTMIHILESYKSSEIFNYIDYEIINKKINQGNFSRFQIMSFLAMIVVLFKFNNFILPRKIARHKCSEIDYDKAVILRDSNNNYFKYNGENKKMYSLASSCDLRLPDEIINIIPDHVTIKSP